MVDCNNDECSCVFLYFVNERMVEFTKEPSYTIPSGLSREERRKWISDIGGKLLTESVTEGEIVVKE